MLAAQVAVSNLFIGLVRQQYLCTREYTNRVSRYLVKLVELLLGSYLSAMAEGSNLSCIAHN